MTIWKHSLFSPNAYETCRLDPSCVQLRGVNCIVVRVIKGIFTSHEAEAVSLIITKSLLCLTTQRNPHRWNHTVFVIGGKLIIYFVYNIKIYSSWAGQTAQLRTQVWFPAPKPVSSQSTSLPPLLQPTVEDWLGAVHLLLDFKGRIQSHSSFPE